MRITLATKLKKTGEFENASRLVKSVGKPVKLIQDKYNVTYATAKKFVDEVHGFTPLTKEHIEPEEDKNSAIAKLFVKDLDRIVYQNPFIKTLLDFGNRLETFNINILIEVYKILSENTPASNVPKYCFVKAIKYIIQKRFYSKVFGCDMPLRLEDKTQEYIAVCQR